MGAVKIGDYVINRLIAAVIATVVSLPICAAMAAPRDLLRPGSNSAAPKAEPPAVVEDHLPAIELPAPLDIQPPDDNSTSSPENSEIIDPDVEERDEKPDRDLFAKPDLVTPPAIQRDVSKLPLPVARMRQLIMQAARSGQIEKLQPLIGSGENITMLSLGGIDGDPVEFLKSLSGDDQGHEILAILLEVLEAGYVHLDAGTDNELYVWPYFFAWPLDKLSREQKVELFRIVTAGDLEDMESFGGYIFYRVGISPKGRWRFFVAGD